MNISSVSALRPSPGTAAYGAAKAGVDSLTRSLAVEWGPNVRVNTRRRRPVPHRADRRPLRRRRDRRARSRRRSRSAGWPNPPRSARWWRSSPPTWPATSPAPPWSATVAASRLPSCYPARRTEGEPVTLLEGRIAIVTGAGRGIGRAHALELARQGAKVVVNDLGTSGSGEGSASEVAHEVVAEIEALGGEAVANGADVADFEQAAAMVQQAIDTFGGLDILVNNAGLRPRPDAGEHLRGGVGRRDPGAPQGSLRAAAARRRVVAQRVQGGSPAGGPGRSTPRRVRGCRARSARRRTPQPRPASPG